MGLYPKNLNEYAASLGIPRGPLSKTFFVDPVNGSPSNTGTTWQSPLLSLEAAYALTTDNRHDCILFLAGATACNPAATIPWTKSYTHLVGVGCELPGLGQRCRVVNDAAVVMHGPVITFSGNGCIVKNMQFGNEHGAGTATGVVLVSGERNYFENVFFMVPFATDAGSYSLKVSGGENCFKNCTIGQHTCVRNAGTHSLWVVTGNGDANRNKFIHCEFLSWATGGGTAHQMVTIATDVAGEAWTIQFDDCLFLNVGAAALDHMIVDGATDIRHRVILRGNNFFHGSGAGIANPVTYVYSGVAAAAASATAVVPAN